MSKRKFSKKDASASKSSIKGFKEKELSDDVKTKGFKSHSNDKKPIYRRGPNDSSWRTKNTLSTKLAASLPFEIPNGILYDISTTTATANVRTPGVMRVGLLLTAGTAIDYNSPINIAGRKMYAYIRKGNSGAKNWDAVDGTVLLVAMANAYGCLGWLQRLYRTVCKFSAVDRFQPVTLVHAMQVDYDDIKQHQAELAWLIHWMGTALQTIPMPSFPILTASYDAFRHIYTDDSSPRKQIYLFDAFNFGVYNPAYDSNGGGVDYDSGNEKVSTWGSGLGTFLTYSQIYSMVKDIMDPLQGDEDVGIIAGDIMKAYDESQLFKPASDAMDIIELEYSEEILQQIHNCRTFSTGLGQFNGYGQDPGTPGTAPWLKQDFALATAAAPGFEIPHKYDIDAFSAEPSPEEIVNCTALQCRVKYERNAGLPVTIKVTRLTFDLYLPVTVEIFVDPIGVATYDIATEVSDCKVIDLSQTVPAGVVKALNFDWAPFAYAYGAAPDGNLIAFGDVRMLNYFDFNVHERIHENSVLCLLDVLEN